MSITPKKTNLITFWRSDDFNKARVMFCALYILISYANEKQEELTRLLKGYEGLWIGDLKRAAKEATKALERFDKEYLSFIGDGGATLSDVNVEMTSAIDDAIDNNSYYLQEGYKAIKKVIDEQIDKTVFDEKELKESFFGFELVGEKEREMMKNSTLKRCKARLDDFHGDVLKGVEIGFDSALEFVEQICTQP